jgi:hypothetical protein
MTSAIDHLKKVSLELRFRESTIPFDFIFGIASDGMCPLEYELLHKSVGDRLHLNLSRVEASRNFAHLYRSMLMALSLQEAPETLDLDMIISAVEDANPREVVRAMAQAAESEGCGGDCGCGCGGH